MIFKRKCVCIVVSIFSIFLTMFTSLSLNSLDRDLNTINIVNNDFIEVNLSAKKDNENVIWNVEYEKKSTEAYFSMRIDNYSNDIEVIPDDNYIQKDNIIEELDNLLFNNIVRLKGNKNFDKLIFDVKLSGPDNETLYLQNFSIDLASLLNIEQSILDKNSKVQEDNIHNINHLDPFRYLTDENGQYLKHNVGNATFKNYNYSVTPDNQLNEPEIANVLTNGTNLNFYNGYHFYPWLKGDVKKSNVLTKQTVKESAIEGTFDVELDVIGGATEISEERDIMFVFDKSYSMNEIVDGNKTRWNYLTESIKLFSDKLLIPGSDKIRIGMTSYGTDSNGSWADSAMFSNNKHTFTSHTQNIINHKMIHNIDSIPLKNSKSPTFLGVKTAVDAINNRPANEQSRKVMIILITASSSDIMPEEDYQGKITSSYSNSDKITRYRLPINKHNSTPEDIRKLNDEIVVGLLEGLNNTTRIAMGLGKNESRDSLLEAFTGEEYTENNAFNHLIMSSSDLYLSFEVIKRLASGSKFSMELGTLDNPLAEDLVLINNDVKISGITVNYDYDKKNYYSITEFSENQQPQYINNINLVVDSDTGTPHINLNNINLGSIGNNRMGLRIKYQIKLPDNFNENEFKLISKEEGSRVKAYNYDNPVYFATPSVRKVSDETRVTEITFNKKSNNENLANAVFNLYEIIADEEKLIASSQSDIDGNFKFTNIGKGEYVLKEMRMLGFSDFAPIKFGIDENMNLIFEQPSVLDDLGTKPIYTINNKLNPFKLIVNKLDNKNNPLIGANFELCKKNDSFTCVKAINQDTSFIFEDLSVGEYILKETIVPDGHVALDDQIIVINHDASVMINGDRYTFEEEILENNEFSLQEEVVENGKLINVINFNAINIKKGVLPSTGSNKMFIYLLISLFLIVLGLSINRYLNYSDFRKKRNSRLIVLLSISIVLTSSITRINAKNNHVKIVIHKSVYTDPDANPDHRLNDGLNNVHNEETVRFNNVKFDVYDFSNYIKNNSKELEVISEEIVNLARDDLIHFAKCNGDYIEKIETKNVNGQDGVAETYIPIKEYTAILLIEKQIPLYEDKYLLLKNSLPMLVVLPIINIENPGEFLSTINLYPKSYGYSLDKDESEELDKDYVGEEEKVPTGVSFDNFSYILMLVSGLSLIFLIKINRGNKE